MKVLLLLMAHTTVMWLVWLAWHPSEPTPERRIPPLPGASEDSPYTVSSAIVQPARPKYTRPELPVAGSWQEKRVWDMVVVGGGVGGCATGLYAARAGLSVLMVSAGNGELAMSEMVANYPGVAPVGGIELLERFSKQATGVGVQRLNAKVAAMTTHSWPYAVTAAEGTRNRTLQAWSVVLASGATLRWPGVAKEQLYAGKTIHTCPLCDGHLYLNKTVVVLGGGNSAADAAAYLANICRKVYLVHRRTTFRATKATLARAMRARNLEVKTPFFGVEWISREDGGMILMLRHTKTGTIERIDVDGAFVAVGSTPVTDYLVKEHFRFRTSGHVKVGLSGVHTSVAGVYAVGEIADFKYRQAVTAAAAGAVAATEADTWIDGQPEVAAYKQKYGTQESSHMEAMAMSMPPSPPVATGGPDPAREIECEEVAISCLKTFIAAHQVVVFSKSYCPYCTRAKQLLADLNVADVRVVELDTSTRGTEVQKVLETLTGRRTVPNIFIRGNNIGGSDELERERDILELLLKKTS